MLLQKSAGTDQDYNRAMKWYRKAAEQGYADAQYNIGYMYKNGKGVEQDKAKSFSWYRKAAQLNVSFYYITGAGEEQGNQKAIAALDRLGC